MFLLNYNPVFFFYFLSTIQAVVLPLTTDDIKNILPVEVFINNTKETGLDYPSKILCDSPFTWNKELRFEKKLGTTNQETIKRVEVAWKIAFDWTLIR